MAGAPVELDKRLGGVIGSLRERAEFIGDRGETLLIVPPQDSIKARLLLLVGLGAEDALSLDVMEEAGRISLREAARLGISLAELLRRSLRTVLPVNDTQPWMRYAGMVESGDPHSSQKIDDVVYGRKD